MSAPRRRAAVELHAGVVVNADEWWKKVPGDVVSDLAAARKAAADVRSAEARLRSTVQQLRTANVSWSAIGDALGVTRTAAQKRFGKDVLL